MDRFFVDNVDLNEKKVLITGEDVKHISKVLRCRVGEKLEICDKKNNEYICEIVNIEKDLVNLDIIETVDINRETNLRVKVYQGVPKGPKMEYILQKLTEVGVVEIILVDTKRSVSKLDKKEDKKLDRFERIIYEASKQSKRGQIPKLRLLSFDEALKDMKENDFNIVPYENERTKSIKNVLKSIEKIDLGVDSIGIFVGPEGGIDEEEIKKLQKIGAKSVSLGNRILRTETASVVASSIVIYELDDLGGQN